MEPIYEPGIERDVLGAVFVDNKCFDEIARILHPDIFSEKNRIIYETIENLYQQGSPIDNITVYEHLKKRNLLEQAGGSVYISLLTKRVSSSENVGHHSKILLEKWMLRRLQKTKYKLENINETTDPFELMSELNREIYELENFLGSKMSDRSLWGEFTKLMEKVEQRYEGKLPAGIMSQSFPSLNRAIGGIMPVDFVVVYGLEKQGKTSWTERLALDFAFQKIPVAAFTMEMDFDAYCYKALSMEGNIDYLKLRNPRNPDNRLEEKEFHEFYKRALKFQDTKIFIDDKTFGFEEMIAKAKYWKRKYNIGLFVFDYLGLIKTRQKFDRRDLEISYYTQTMKALAKELSTPVIAVSQANENEKTADSKGALRDTDFAIRLCKPIELGIKSITNKENEPFYFDETHFLATVERSRFGRNKQNFVCGFSNNNFIEINTEKPSTAEYI